MWKVQTAAGRRRIGSESSAPMTQGRRKNMCKLSDAGIPQTHFRSRRNFFKAAAATGVVAGTGLNLFATRASAAEDGDVVADSGPPGRRYVIRGGSGMSMDPKVGDFAE